MAKADKPEVAETKTEDKTDSEREQLRAAQEKPEDVTLLAKLGAANSEVEQLRAQLRAAQAAHAGVKGELAEAHQALRDAREEIVQLRTKLNQGAISALPDLGTGAYELSTSVVIPNHQGHRIDARKGDVVTEDEPEALQAKLGKVARVFRVRRETLDDLLEHQHLRV